MGDVFIWRYFNQLVIRRFVWGEEPDQALVAKTLAEDVPEVLGYLERLAPAAGFLFGTLSIADVSIATFFRNAAFARFTIDAARWPGTAAWVARVLATEGFQRLVPFEERLLRTPIPQVREALAAIGAPLMRETYGTAAPRRGVMPL
jgi:glutathione S-transferase